MFFIRRISIVMVLMLAAAAVVAGCGGGEEAAATAFPDSLVDGELVATVNDRPITGRDLRVFTLIYQPATVDSLHDRMFNLELLNGYIDRIVLWQEARAAGMTVPDSTHAWYLNRFEEAFGGPERVEATLSQFGITRDELESVIRRDLLVRQLIEKRIAPGIEVTEAEARNFYDNNPEQFTSGEQVHARHIIILTKPSDSDSVLAQKRDKLQDILARARSGEDFAELAKNYSQGPSAQNGGDLGFFSREQMVAPFAQAAFALEPGEISDVVETRFGYHIIKLEERRDAETIGFDEVHDRLMDGLYDRELNTAVENHLQQTRSVAIIEPNFDIGGLTQRESTTFTR